MQDVSQTIMRILLISGAALAIGLVTAFCAVFFVDVINYLNQLLLPVVWRTGAQIDWSTVLMIVMVPVAGGLVAGQVRRLIDGARVQGPADVIELAQLGKGEISLRNGIFTALSNLIWLGAGASAGQYGPLVHLGATIGGVLGRADKWLREDFRLPGPVALGCGVAAAIATVFSAPIAGVVFAHEVVLRHYSLRAFAPVTIAATAGYLVSSWLFERPPLFFVAVEAGAHPVAYGGFVVIGLFGGVVSLLYMRAVLQAGALADKTPLHNSLKPGIAGLLLGLIALGVPQVTGLGIGSMQSVIAADGFPMGHLLLILLAKILATAICTGYARIGGVFAPALFIGTFFGAIVGGLVAATLGSDLAVPAFYAICGLAAVTSPVVGAPLTTILIVFELTRNYELTTAVMVSVVLANLVAGRFFGRSLFDVQLLQQGIDLSQGREKVLLQQHRLREYLQTDFVALAPDMTIRQAQQMMGARNAGEAYVITQDNRFLGILQASQLLAIGDRPEALEDTVSAHVTSPQLVFSLQTTIWDAMEGMAGFVGETIPVLNDDDDAQLAGIVTEAMIVHASVEISRRLRLEENATG